MLISRSLRCISSICIGVSGVAAQARCGRASMSSAAESCAPAAATLAGKKAIVVGGTSGIGLASALKLRDLGAEV